MVHFQKSCFRSLILVFGFGLYTALPPAIASAAAENARTGQVAASTAGCTYTLSDRSVNVSPAGQFGLVTVTTDAGCPFTVTNDGGYISAPTGNFSGTTTIPYYAGNNLYGPVRTAILTIAGQSFSITQSELIPIGTVFSAGNTSPSLVPNAFDLTLTPQSASITQSRTLYAESHELSSVVHLPPGSGGFTPSVLGSPQFVTITSALGPYGDIDTLMVNGGGLTPGTYLNLISFAGYQDYLVRLTIEDRLADPTHSAPIGKAGIFRQSPPDGQVPLVILDQNADGVCCNGDLIGGFGAPGDIPLTGDWTGDGVKKVGLYRPSNGLFLLDLNHNGVFDGGDQALYLAAQPGDVPVIGDWTGSGTDRAGIFRADSGTWYLDTTGDGSFTGRAYLGQDGDIPLTGNWNGVGTQTKVGIYRPAASNNGQPGSFFLLDTNGDGQYTSADQPLFFLGQSGDVPLVGDWNGDGRSKLGVYRPANGLFLLDRNGDFNFSDSQDTILFFAPFVANRTVTNAQPGDIPVTGNWPMSYGLNFLASPQSTYTRTGLYRPSTGTFFFDTLGDGSFQGRAYLGQAGDVPIGVPVISHGVLVGVNALGNF